MLKTFMQSRQNGSPSDTSTAASEANKPVATSPTVQASKAEAAPAAPKPAPQEEGNKLIVGPNIKLKGSEITDCEILVVEGRVEASMKSRHIRIAEGGVFCGKAEIDVAEIRGHFEGELIAHKRLVIYSTGKVTGQIQYGSMTMEEGASISGSMEMLAPENDAVNAAGLATASISPAQGTVARLGSAYPATLLSRHMANKQRQN
ncbi:hypothetical protein CAP31_09330 [Sulfuriferula sp. AH1]|uniref:bactofilin family protein n=1 Tax=Sulfuriferula sp. AH1 TaxID=1985873 RepID=UPI000B3B9572|nr:polymer-forming cytoskeletal protein [Sulfuriferula sp. AH1]ARU31855.1 hypothetical protein CAP31_09330 [Sulfuriferula sp. AH1]